MNTIAVKTLRAWLEVGDPVTIVDVRPIMTTLAQIKGEVDLLHATCPDFVQMLLSRLPATPPNFDRIIMLNERGLLPEVPVTELEAGTNRCAIS